MQKSILFKSKKEVQDYAAQHDKILLIFDTYVLDATTFVARHPGGVGLIYNCKSKDVTLQMESHFPLSLTLANTMVIGTFEKEIKQLIDPEKPIVKQIWNMDYESYLKVIDSPHWLFVESPRMFESNFFEWFSHNKWYHIYFFPFTIIFYMFLMTDFTNANLPFLLATLILGMMSFTFCEYMLHRFIFHSERNLEKSRHLRYLQFLIHGIHHMLPVDRDRTVLPPAMAVIGAIVGYFTLVRMVSFENPQISTLFWTGFMLGYLMYETTHYFLHHYNSSRNKETYFYKLQRYHNQHHYGGELAGFGVSSKFWDIVFGTEMKKKAKH